MGKALFWVAVFFAGIFITRLLAIQAAKKRRRPPQAASKTSASNNASESMVRCAHCGVHLPRSEATLLGNNTWCSSSHAQLGARHHDS